MFRVQEPLLRKGCFVLQGFCKLWRFRELLLKFEA